MDLEKAVVRGVGMELKKPIRLKDEEYLEFIRLKPCIICHMKKSEVHHVKTKGAGGSDYLTVPLCSKHHISGSKSVHNMGILSFSNYWNINLYEYISTFLVEYYGKTRK